MKEANLLRLVQAFVISRVTYATPYLRLQRAEAIKIDALLRRAYKRAIGLPLNTSTERFEALGLTNSLDELIEAQRLGQLVRLTYSTTGRHILDSLGIAHPHSAPTSVAIPSTIQENIQVSPLPRNMHPTHNRERREARARALQRRFAKVENVAYADAADYAGREAMAIAVVNNQGNTIASCSIRARDSVVGEEVAIALAMVASTKIKTIISDSKSAILNFSRGHISREASAILISGLHLENRTGKINLIWTPAHSGLAGNESAHEAARGFTDRADGPSDAELVPMSGRDRLLWYSDIIGHYRLGRARFPPAHPSLSKRHSVVWRLLQTHSYPNPLVYSYCYPGRYSPQCHRCQERADLAHMLWQCPQAITNGRTITNSEQWETVLLSSSPEDQLWAVQLAEDAARAQGLTADD